MTTLHSGGKFGSKAYETSGGLHGVGVSVVNALASELLVEVARNRSLYAQRYARGAAARAAGHDRRGAQSPRHHHQLRPRHGDLRPDRPLPAGAAAPDGAQQGLSFPWASRSAGAAIRPCSRPARRYRPRTVSTSRKASRTSSKHCSTAAIWWSTTRSPARRRWSRVPGSNGRSPGRSTRRPTPAGTATPSRRRSAARTRPACATRCSRACGPMPNGSASSAPTRSPPTT